MDMLAHYVRVVHFTAERHQNCRTGPLSFCISAGDSRSSSDIAKALGKTAASILPDSYAIKCGTTPGEWTPTQVSENFELV
jgi:hypothetical protein